MKCFSLIYIAELKKILQKKSVWIAIVTGLLLVLLVALTNFSADGKGAYIKYQEGVLLELSGQKIDQEFLDNYHNAVEAEIQNNWEEYEKISEYDPGMMYFNASSAIGERALYDLLYNVMRDRERVITVSEDEFYEAMRQDVINDAIDFGVNQNEIDTWLTSYDSLDKPIEYSYALSYTNILDVLFIIGWALIINTSVALSGVFADEKTNKTDALILSSRQGRMPICIAKIMASITVSIAQALILLGGCFGVMFSVYGACGWNSMIQNIIPSSPWNITIGQMVMIYFGLAIVSSIFFTMTNLLISHLTSSSVATMAIHAAIIFAGLFNVPPKLGVISKIWQLRPTMPLYYGTFCNTFMYGRLNNVEASLLIYIASIALMILFLNLTYNRSQITR